jgi:hypothetical protein
MTTNLTPESVVHIYSESLNLITTLQSSIQELLMDWEDRGRDSNETNLLRQTLAGVELIIKNAIQEVEKDTPPLKVLPDSEYEAGKASEKGHYS